MNSICVKKVSLKFSKNIFVYFRKSFFFLLIFYRPFFYKNRENSILMLENNFIAPSINIDNLDPAVMPTEIARQLKQKSELDTVMTNSFGFGGTNGSMLLSKLYE